MSRYLFIRVEIPDRDWGFGVSIAARLLSQQLGDAIFLSDPENERMIVKLA